MQIKINKPIDKYPHSPSSLPYQQNIRQVAQTTRLHGFAHRQYINV